MNGNLMQMLKQLRLSGLIESLEVRLQEAVGNGLSHAEFLELVLSDELATRRQRAIDRRLKQAQFREMKTLDQFDFSFNSSLPKRRIMDLATGRFIREAADVLLLARNREEPLLPSRGPQCDQSGLLGALPFDLRCGPRLPA